ncbi:MAG: hypothetical protein AB1410_01780 [Acidobacteriota bacterium]
MSEYVFRTLLYAPFWCMEIDDLNLNKDLLHTALKGSARSLSDKREVINSSDISVLRKAPMCCSAKRLRRSFSHRESVMSHKNKERYLSDMTLGDYFFKG